MIDSVRRSVLVASLLLLSGGSLALRVPRSGPEALVDRTPPVAPRATGAEEIARGIPPAFVPNEGQWDHPARYVATMGAVTALLEDRGWWLALLGSACESEVGGGEGIVEPSEGVAPAARGAALRMRFVGAEPASELVPEEHLPGVHNYYLGNDPRRWRTGVARYGAVRFRGLYPGVEARAYGKDGHFEYDLMLAPGADLARVEVEVEGADSLRLDEEGTLVIGTAVGPVRQPRPTAYATAARGRGPEVACLYDLRGGTRFGFAAPGWDGRSGLEVDPGLLYSTYFGGLAGTTAFAMSVDAAGVVTIGGWVVGGGGGNFPTSPGAWDPTQYGAADGFVSRLNPSTGPAGLLYSTFLGGNNVDEVHALAVDAAGVVTVSGITASTDFPTSPGAWDTTFAGPPNVNDVFVSRLDPSLSGAAQLLYSTYLGGSGAGPGDYAEAVSADAAGIVTVAGSTNSVNFPTTGNAYDSTYNGYGDAFVSRLDPSLSGSAQLVYSTFLGGGLGGSAAESLFVDAAGVVTVAGEAGPVFPTTPGAFATTSGGGTPGDAFVTRLDPSQTSAAQLLASTYLGATSTYLGGITPTGQSGALLSVDAGGVVTIAGTTEFSNFPTTPNAWDTTFGPPQDAFVARLDSSLSSLLYGTYLGAPSAHDRAGAIAVDSSGAITVGGWTYFGTGFPVTPGAYDTTWNGGFDVFVARLNPSLPAGQQLVYSTYLGGAGNEFGYGVSGGAAGEATVTGYTSYAGFPTTPGAYQTIYVGGGGAQAFVTRLDMLPAGASLCGSSSPGCAGPLAIGVASIPKVGNANFAITCTNAPPNSPLGFLLLSVGPCLPLPVPVLGINLWIDLSTAFIVPGVASNANGFASLPIPIGPNPAIAGGQVAAQFVWVDFACPATFLSASAGLSIVLQP